MPASSFFRLIMGNEKSLPSDLHFEDVIKVSDCWTLKSATLQNGVNQICIFEQCLQNGSIEPLQKLSKNLMLHRHPCILKYISSWKTNKMLYVATEFAKPLSLTLSDKMPMQLCIGLFNILKAITFLEEKALAAHNNLSKDAIYVTNDECWKLGQLDLLSRKNEPKKSQNNSHSLLVDQRDFAALAQELLNGKTNDEIPNVVEFRELCKSYVMAKNPNPQFLQQLFKHPFFTHQFIAIYLFLIELPLKSEAEKAEFFISVAEKLSSFPEELVARQLGTLLLSRLVLLNITAQNYLLPKIFTPRNENDPSLLFSEVTTQKYIMPKLMSIFSLRDSQIRLILLKYFPSFFTYFTKEQLQIRILPELLVGIKDTNEQLVAATLHTLADLVPILGSSVVIGKGRAKIFADGRPLMKNDKCAPEEYVDGNLSSHCSPITETEFILTDRPSPDGGEDSTESANITAEESISEINPVKENIVNHCSSLKLTAPKTPVPPPPVCLIDEKVKPNTSKVEKKKLPSLVYTPSLITTEDLNTLDIKCSKSKNDDTDNDIEKMFKDMEPVISKTAVVKVTNGADANKFKAADLDSNDCGGWGDDNWEDLEELEVNE